MQDDDSAATAMTSRTREILPLTGIRFPVTLAVLLLHVGSTELKPAGGSRVPLFFVLSGFVMTAAYFPRRGQGLSTLAFVAKRVARLYPLLVVTSLAVAFWFFRDAVLPSWHNGRPGPAFARTVLVSLTAVLFPPSTLLAFPYAAPNGYAWFVLVELSAGLFFPASVRLLWRLKPWALLLVLVALPPAATAYSFLIAPHVPSIRVPHLFYLHLAYTPLVWLFILLFGAATYRAYLLARGSGTASLFLRRLATPAAGLALWLVYFESPLAAHWYSPVLLYYLFGFALLTLSLSGGLGARVLSIPPLLYLGGRSYSIYMMSAPVTI